MPDGPCGETSRAPTDPGRVSYDKRKLSYAHTFENAAQANLIRILEWATGKRSLLGVIRRFEASGVPRGQAFWPKALDIMGIDVTTRTEQVGNIPSTGPVVVVANHPHGLVDGMVLAEIIGRVRTDYRILTRSLLTGVEEIESFMIPVPFPHETHARKKNLEMRKRTMAHLRDGGLVAVFPSGSVAASETWLGPAVEGDWNAFTAKIIARSGARVVPVYFPGQNSRWYQFANKISATLRQGLLLHEVVHALNRPQAPVIGPPIPEREVEARIGHTTNFMRWLRDHTLGLSRVSWTGPARPPAQAAWTGEPKEAAMLIGPENRQPGRR